MPHVFAFVSAAMLVLSDISLERLHDLSAHSSQEAELERGEDP